MRLERFCKCGYHAIVNEPASVICPLCQRVVHIEPPRWVRLLQRLSKPQDTGLGATVNRIAARFGGERFKKWATKIGLPCGCTEREAHWNKLYPNPHYRQM